MATDSMNSERTGGKVLQFRSAQRGGRRAAECEEACRRSRMSLRGRAGQLIVSMDQVKCAMFSIGQTVRIDTRHTTDMRIRRHVDHSRNASTRLSNTIYTRRSLPFGTNMSCTYYLHLRPHPVVNHSGQQIAAGYPPASSLPAPLLSSSSVLDLPRPFLLRVSLIDRSRSALVSGSFGLGVVADARGSCSRKSGTRRRRISDKVYTFSHRP